MKKQLVLALITLLTAASLRAQGPRGGSDYLPCPHPITLTIEGNKNPPAPDPNDFGSLYPKVQGSQWNQTAIDKAFGTTFHFPAPGKECCIMTSATLTVTIKALQGGAFNTASSGNDGVNIISHGQSVLGVTPWPTGATTGQTKTLTINVPPSVLANGEFSLYVQDDTAVINTVLRLQGCCLR
jgi:hypothetical protein